MTDKDQLERLKWQITQEIGLRAQMTERMEKAEKAAGVLRHDLQAALHTIESQARADNNVRTRLREKAKQQLADSLKSENATLARLEKTERELAAALTAKSTALDRCTVLQKERDEWKKSCEIWKEGCSDRRRERDEARGRIEKTADHLESCGECERCFEEGGISERWLRDVLGD